VATSTFRWLVTLILTVMVAAGTAYSAVVLAGREAGIQEQKVAQLETAVQVHTEDTDVHLSISAAVALEHRLSSLEGAIRHLNASIESLDEKLEKP